MKRLCFVLGIVIFSLFTGIAYAQLYSDIDIIKTDQTPYPAEPGSNVEIELSLQNNGYGEASNIALEIVPSYPFSLVKGEQVKTFQTIGARNSVKITYTLLVDDSALAGDYDLELRIYNPLTPSAYQTHEIGITVIGETKIIVENVDTIPDMLEPGGTARIHVTLKNVGTGDARQLEARMNSSSSALVPVLSGGMVYVGDLAAGEEKSVDFTFNVDPDAEQETYLASLSLTYKDEDNQARADTFTIGIPVSGNIIFEVVSIEPKYNKGTLDIEVANKGTGDAKSIEAKLIVDEKTIGVEYLSQLTATKKTTLNFPLVLTGDAELTITYMEPDLEQKTVKKEIGPLNFSAPSSGGSFTALFVIIIVVAGYFIWRRYFRKKKRR